MKILNRVCAVVFLLMFAAPLLQATLRVLPKASLGGVESKSRKPEFTAGSWFTGKYQPKYEKWLNDNISLRSYFVRTYNQVYFSLFGKIPASRGTQVVIGKDFWLFESVYVNAYQRNGDTPDAKLRKIVADLRTLQEKMKARGKTLVLVIAPSKVEIYPEHLPDGLIKKDRRQLRTERDRILPLLDENGINYIDAHRIFLEKKKTQPYPLFSTGGTHWNYYGAGIIVEQLMGRIGTCLGKKVPNIQCKSVNIDRIPFNTDNDLGALLNIWFSKRLVGPQVHPVFERKEGEYSPNILCIGDSFLFTLTDIIGAERLSSRCDIFFYFKRRFVPLDNAGAEKVDPDTIDWDNELLSRDAVIIEISEYWLPDIGFGFVKAALAGIASLESGSAP